MQLLVTQECSPDDLLLKSCESWKRKTWKQYVNDKTCGAPFEQILNAFSSYVVRLECCGPLSLISKDSLWLRYVLLLLLFGIFHTGNYEIHLPDISVGYVSFPQFPWPSGDFTICFWLKTKHSGFFIEYEVAISIEQNATLVLGLYFYNRHFEILFGNIRRYQTIVAHWLF